MATFTSTDALKKEILRRCEIAVKKSADEIHQTIDGNLVKFYGFKPDYYVRTGRLMHSLDYPEVNSYGNGVSAKVGFDVGQLDYPQGAVRMKNGEYGWATWDGEQVLEAAMHGSNTATWKNPTAVWDESMAELGNVDAIIKNELSKVL